MQHDRAFHVDNGGEYTVLFSHGNAEDLGMLYHVAYFEYFYKVGQERVVLAALNASTILPALDFHIVEPQL